MVLDCFAFFFGLKDAMECCKGLTENDTAFELIK